MKKQLISRLCACLVVALCGMPLMAQGVIVYQKDGAKVKYPYELIDSIVTYNHGEEVEDEPVSPPDSDDTAIRFIIDDGKNAGTRGIGAINGWCGQKFKVYMFDKGTLERTVNATTKEYIFNNADVISSTTSNSNEATYGDYEYYPDNGSFDFFAYYGDDAVTTEPALNEHGDAYTVAVNIDGTQDLMVAKAGMSEAERNAYEGAGFDNMSIYSAYSARRNVNPRFAFRHLLSRFVFQAEAAEEDVAGENGIRITKVEVEAPSTGVMTVAALDEEKLGVVFDSDKSMIELTNCGSKMNVEELIYGEKVRLGESLLLPAGTTEYIVNIHYEQNRNGMIISDVYTAPIVLSNRYAFKPGFQYNVNIKVYGFTKIIVTSDYQVWEEGKDIPVDSE